MARRGGFDSERVVSFAATARDPSAKATDWFRLGDARAEMPKAASTSRRNISVITLITPRWSR